MLDHPRVDAHGLHGIFAKLAQLDFCDAPPGDLYGHELAGFYDKFVGEFVGDIPVFERLLVRSDARVLDLACGAGRIGIALARDGYRVDGLEMSADMLALANANLAAEPATVQDRLRFVQGDMSRFDLPDRYDLAILGVTSISLLLSRSQRVGLFGSVARHLAPGGRMVFDILNLEGERWQTLDGMHDVWSRETEDGLDVGFIGQRFFPDDRRFVFNVYREVIAWDGTTRRTIGSSTKAWLSRDQLVAEMTEAGLQLIEEMDEGAVSYFIAGAQA